MPQDGPHDAKQSQPAPTSKPVPERNPDAGWRDRFGAPEPVKKVFRKFPLTTYACNELPITSPARRDEHSLWIWTTLEGARDGALSFNPSCLKWQTYLKFQHIPFHTIASNNHASPSGSLPFLIPATIDSHSTSTSPAPSTSNLALPNITTQPTPIPSNQLLTWAQENNGSTPKNAPTPPRTDAYTALLDHRIRRAWLYTLYLEPANFTAVAKKLYIAPSSANPLVGSAIAYQLKKAAQDELLKLNAYVSAEELLEEAKEAFAALETLLGGDEWFFGGVRPGLFDAGVFAYTYLLLDEGMGWMRGELGDVVRGHAALVRHRDRILQEYFS